MMYLDQCLPHNHIGGKRRLEAEESPESLPGKSLNPFCFGLLKKRKRRVDQGRSESGEWVMKKNYSWVFDTCSSCSVSRTTCGCFRDALINNVAYICVATFSKQKDRIRQISVYFFYCQYICLLHNCFYYFEGIFLKNIIIFSVRNKRRY